MKTVLVIDDDPAIRRLLTTVLEKSGFAVMTAENGKEGMDTYRRCNPDLVLTDIVMPDREGLEVIQELHQLNPAIKIIAISGAGGGTGAYLQLAETFGAARIFEKPFRPQEIVSAAQELTAD